MKNKTTKLFMILMLVSIFVLAVCTLASAEQVYNGGFIKNGYTLYSAQGIISGSHDLCSEPLGGRTRVCFDVCADSIAADGEIAIESQKYGNDARSGIVTFDFVSSDSDVAMTPTNADSCSLEPGQIYSIVADIDLNTLVYDLAVYKGQDYANIVYYKKSAAIDPSCMGAGIKSVTIDVTDVAVTDLAVVRERISDDTPLIDMNNNIATIGAALSPELAEGDVYDVFVAFYSPDRQTLIHTEKRTIEYKGYDDYIEVSFELNEYFKGQYPISVLVFRKSDKYPVTAKTARDISNGSVKVEDYLAYANFEADAQYTSSQNVTGGKVPKDWLPGGWGGNSAPYDISMVSDDNGGYLSIGSITAGQIGIQTPMQKLPAGGISVSCEYKASDSYTGNRPRLLLLYYTDNGNFNSSENTVFYNISSDVWTKGEWFIDPSRYPEGVSKFRIAFTNSYISSLGETAGGRLYYDNLRVEGCTFGMVCDEEISWYNLGDTVVYKPKGSLPSMITKICGNVYNSAGELLQTVSCSAEDVHNGGWQYTPAQSGFYKVVFYAVSKYNTITYEKMEYKAYYDDKTAKNIYIEKGGHDFYVSAFTNPAIEDRNDLYGMSILPGDGQYDMDIADKVGMSFLRLHTFSWMNIEPENVTKYNGKSYDWSSYDYLFDRIKNGLKFRVIGNILSTPKWASSNKDETVNNVPMYSSFAPTDNKYLTDFIDDLYARYGEYIDTWEIYNEPHINGGSVFWHDTAENFVNMLAAAYNELKKLSNNQDTVVMGGIGARRYLPFYTRFLEKGGWAYTDKLPMHGYDLDPWNYFKVNEAYGLGKKGVIDTEAHVILFNGSTTDVNYTEKQIGLRLLNEYLRQIKYGVERIAFFQPYDNHLQAEDVKIINSLVDGWSVVAAGLFRKKPNFEPRFAAGVLNTLISKSGNTLTYADEFKTGNVNIVKLNADGQPLYIIWADDLACDNGAYLSGITVSADIVDWEGREVSASGFGVANDTVYFVTGLADDAFGYLESAQGTEVYNGKVVYCENEAQKQANKGTTMDGTTVSVFNHQTGEVTDSEDVVWNDTYFESGADLHTKVAVAPDDDGLEFVLKFDKSSLLTKGLLNLSIDTFANGINSDVVAFEGHLYGDNNGSYIKKTRTPDFGGDLPSASFTTKGNNLPDSKQFVTTSDDYIYYCIYIPWTQLYPYSYEGNTGINMSFKFSGYNASGSVSTQMRMDSNSYNSGKPDTFCVVKFAEHGDKYQMISIPVTVLPDEYVAVKISEGEQDVYFEQYQADSDGKCTIIASLPKGKQYKATIYAVSAGYTEEDIDTSDTE